MPDLLHGPLNKTLYTHTLELVTKIMLYSKEPIKFYYHRPTIKFDMFGLFNKNELHMVIDDVDINLSQLFSKANFSHIKIDQSDNANDNVLTAEEKRAIHSYTFLGYLSINDLLYQNYQWSNLANNYATKQNVLRAVLLSSGLNKRFPSPDDHTIKTYRGERHTSRAEIQRRINLIKQGGGFTEQPAYMSTSISHDISKKFRGNCMIIFDSIYGVSVEKESLCRFEREYLILPGQIYWKKYEYINGIHTFHASAVRPLNPAKEEVCAQDIVNFNKLLAFAKNKGVPVNFLTPYLQKVISDPTTPLSKVAPVMKSAIKSTTQKILNGLNAALQIGIGGYLFGVGLGIIAPPFVITSFFVSLGATCLGGYILLSAAVILIPEIINYVKPSQTVHPEPYQPAPYQHQPALYQPAPYHPGLVLPKPLAAKTTGSATAKQYKDYLEKEQNAVKDLERILKNKFPQAPQFIANLHNILGLETTNGDKLLLLQYAHLLENKVNEAPPENFTVVEKEALEEATKAIKEKTLLI